MIFFQLDLHLFLHHVSRHATIILTKQYSGMAISSSNHYFAYEIWDVYANPSSFLLICRGGYRHDEMQCVITSENLGIVFSCGFTSVIKWAG